MSDKWVDLPVRASTDRLVTDSLQESRCNGRADGHPRCLARRRGLRSTQGAERAAIEGPHHRTRARGRYHHRRYPATGAPQHLRAAAAARVETTNLQRGGQRSAS